MSIFGSFKVFVLITRKEEQPCSCLGYLIALLCLDSESSVSQDTFRFEIVLSTLHKLCASATPNDFIIRLDNEISLAIQFLLLIN